MCRQGLRKTHERSDPACRFHGSDARGNTAVVRGDTARSTGHAAPGDGDGEEPARPRHVPFEQMTRFVTNGAIGPHYLPGPLDKWIRREVVNQAGEWYDSQAGRPLTEAEKGEYEQYRQRLAARRQTGKDADKLAGIVARYLPDVSQETRSYMIWFPHEIKGLLAKARRIRRKMKAKTGRPTTSSHAGKTRKPGTKTKAKAKQQRGGRTEAARKTPQPTARGATAIPTLAEEDVGPLDGGSAEAAAEAGETPQLTAKDATATATHAADNDGQHDEVDWGSAEPASATPDRDTESAKSASPDGGKQLGENLEEPEPGPSSRSTTRVPVVLRPNLGAQRPRTPSRSRRRRPARQPSARAVQEHMRACRQRRSQMRTH